MTVFVLALAILTVFFSYGASTPAFAQEERVGILNRLFDRLRKAEKPEPEPQAQVIKPKPKRKKAVRAPADADEPQPVIAAVAKHPDARVVLVIGDFLASGLAEGLTTAFSENPNVRIVDRSSGSSGFVRSDFHDWSERIPGLIRSENPAAIAIMIGANDRQQMLVDGTRETVRSENWNREYARRAGELAKTIADRKVPFLWVSTPPFRSQKMMLDMLAFNDVYRAAATGAGGEFVDIWDGFVDENGAYVPSGPDINGQLARLRANDGINFARPGKRKIAFYAEKPLYNILGENAGAGDATANLALRPAYRTFGPFGPEEMRLPGIMDMLINPNELDPVDGARPASLRTPGLDGGSELLGAVVETRHEAMTPAEKFILEGFAAVAPSGRADQFAWPQLASAAGAVSQLNIDTTLNRANVPAGPQEPVLDRAAYRPVPSDALAQTAPAVPPRASPEIMPDRLQEISPGRGAPDVAAPAPPITTPQTVAKGKVPDFATGNPRDLSPAREAPQQAVRRPTSIGPEPNRAPTAIPLPVEDYFGPSQDKQEIPSASLEMREDTAPARAPVSSSLPVAAVAPERSAPVKADLVPLASSEAKKVPSELVLRTDSSVAITPDASVEPPAKAAPGAAAVSDERTPETPDAAEKIVPATEPGPPVEEPAPATPAAPTSQPDNAGEPTPPGYDRRADHPDETIRTGNVVLNGQRTSSAGVHP